MMELYLEVAQLHCDSMRLIQRTQIEWFRGGWCQACSLVAQDTDSNGDFIINPRYNQLPS